jgi:hypothetical protein
MLGPWWYYLYQLPHFGVLREETYSVIVSEIASAVLVVVPVMVVSVVVTVSVAVSVSVTSVDAVSVETLTLVEVAVTVEICSKDEHSSGAYGTARKVLTTSET